MFTGESILFLILFYAAVSLIGILIAWLGDLLRRARGADLAPTGGGARRAAWSGVIRFGRRAGI